jgi:ATP-dependent Clp protease ATP-binding subunit ClpC
MTLEVLPAAKDRLIEIGFDPALGARPLRRAVQREVEDKLSEKILHGELKSSSHVVVDFVNGEFTFDNQVREVVAVGAPAQAAAAQATAASAPVSEPEISSEIDEPGF